MPQNADAAHIFLTVRDQIITRFNGQYDVIVGLNHLAVWAAIDAYGIRDRTRVFERMQRVFHDWLARMKNESQ